MEKNIIDERRNATPSWSGYLHQGKVGFLVALRKLKKCIQENTPEYNNYKICYENAEDFDIIDHTGNVLSRHQVKAYKDGQNREKYSDLFNIQKRRHEKGNTSIETSGFQKDMFDNEGNVLEELVNENYRYLHTIVKVPGFDLSKEEYFKEFTNRSRYTENESKIKLYRYSDSEYYCPLSIDNNNDAIREYCVTEMKEIARFDNHNLEDAEAHFENVYSKYVATILDNSIGRAHKESAFPTITFYELKQLITTPIEENEIYITKNNFLYSWEKFCNDHKVYLPYETINIMEDLGTIFLRKETEEFEGIIRELAPHEKKETKLSAILNDATLTNIFFYLCMELKEFDFETLTYEDKTKKKYRISLITIQEHPAYISKVISQIIKNKNFLRRSFDNRYLINDSISGISINESIDRFPVDEIHTLYKEEWETGVTDNIFNVDMEFICVKNAINQIKE